MENNKIEFLKNSIERLVSKKNKIMVFVPETQNPSASVYELYFHATVMKKMGYEVLIFTDVKEYKVPVWIEEELVNFKHISMESAKLTVSTDDLIIIPEIFTNVMEQTKKLPCTRVVLLQSIDYMLNALIPATDFTNFGINKIITTSKKLGELLNNYYPSKYQIYIYKLGIPDYFTKSNKPKKPVISVVGRNPNEVSKVIKLFYAKNPHYSWVTFDTMITESKPPKPLRRKDYAERLKENFAVLWLDRISCFGTLPLEAMRCGCIPIGLLPDITPEYLYDEKGEFNDKLGVWTYDIYSLPNFLGDVLTKFLDDSISDEIYDEMYKVSSEYNQENAEKDLIEIYSKILDDKKLMLESTLKTIENNKEEEIKE